jgi:hypothetical protein
VTRSQQKRRQVEQVLPHCHLTMPRHTRRLRRQPLKLPSDSPAPHDGAPPRPSRPRRCSDTSYPSRVLHVHAHRSHRYTKPVSANARFGTDV